MKQKPFVIDYPVLLNDISPDARMRSWKVFDYLQDAAGAHANVLGVGLKQLKESSSLSWVLSRIRVKMEAFPEYGDTLRITTYPSGFDRLFAYRQFVLSSASDGRRFGVAGSAWLTLNPVNFRPVSPAKHFAGLDEWEFEGETFFQEDTLGKLPAELCDSEVETVQHISSGQIDFNRHLNNAFYAMCTEDWLGEKINSPVRIKEIQLNFNSSTGFRDDLVCSGKIGENGTFYVEGVQRSTGKNAFQGRGEFSSLFS